MISGWSRQPTSRSISSRRDGSPGQAGNDEWGEWFRSRSGTAACFLTPTRIAVRSPLRSRAPRAGKVLGGHATAPRRLRRARSRPCFRTPPLRSPGHSDSCGRVFVPQQLEFGSHGLIQIFKTGLPKIRRRDINACCRRSPGLPAVKVRRPNHRLLRHGHLLINDPVANQSHPKRILEFELLQRRVASFDIVSNSPFLVQNAAAQHLSDSRVVRTHQQDPAVHPGFCFISQKGRKAFIANPALQR